MKNLSLKLSLVAVLVSGSMMSLAAADIVSTTSGANAQPNVNAPVAQTQSLFASEADNTDAVDYVQAEKFTTAEVENEVKSLSTNVLNALNSLKDVLVMKKNPVDGKVSTDDKDVVSSMSHLRANVAEMDRLLGGDKSSFSEQDRKAIAALEVEKKALQTAVTSLETKISAVDKKIPVGNTGIKLGSITIPVLGTTRLQVFPIMEGDQMIGSVRTRCGAYLTEDQLINNKSVNYCVATLWSNSSTRINDAHPKTTTDTYFVGRSESYVAGEVNSVTIDFDTQAKVSPVGFLKHYNIRDKKSLDTLQYNKTVTTGDGHKYAGKDAATD
jgi:hypothetical protein